MLREKIVTTLAWSALCIAGAMLADYVLTVLVLRDIATYTPFSTLAIAAVVTLPTSYALVSKSLELRKARDELAAARDVAVRADKTKTQFFSNMSHELRTPLNAVLGFSELLALDVFAPRRKEYADLIHSAGEHLLSLVNDLLDLSRIEAGKLELHFESLDLAETIDECVETVAPRARRRGLHIVRELDTGLPRINADKRAIKQVLLNLLTNAIKFSFEGSKVEVFARVAPSGEIVFGVQDHGIGIAEDEQAHVFERYAQAHQQSSAEKGTGLGLPIVKGLAEAHGGGVAIESQLKRGTRVTVCLPASRVESVPAVALAS